MNEYYIRLRSRLVPLYGEREARAIAFLVFDEAFGVSRTDIYADKVRQFSQDERLRFVNICQRLAEGEPVQYVLGRAEFCGHSFDVAPGVLIPRPETEELVARAAKTITACAEPRHNGLDADSTLPPAAPDAGTAPHPKVLDAGTGSGCIAISLKLQCPGCRVDAWDISPKALQTAEANARRLQADVHFSRRDLLAPWPATDVAYDLIVSNPPYICERERAEMSPHVWRHEPPEALFVPDADPLRFYRALARAAVNGALRSGGTLMVEINSAYGPETVNLFMAEGLHHVTLHRDAFGHDRVVEGIRSDALCKGEHIAATDN